MTSASKAQSPLDAHGHLISDLWSDQPDAHERIDARTEAGFVSAADALLLHKFVDDGYVTMHIDLDEAATAALDDQISHLWRERPADQPISPPGPGGPRSFADYDGPVRPVGYRLPDLHGFSPYAMDLYLHEGIFRLVELIFDQPAIAFQSLYFEYGSAQALHRDPWYVITKPVAHLVAAWIALEDVTPDSGPLEYIPGSHRLPWFQFEENTVELTPRATPEKRAEYRQWNQGLLRERGLLPPRRFICRRGDVLIWHGGILHGGANVTSPDKTRKSFVVHYSTEANYAERTAFMQVRDGEGLRSVRRSTTTIIETYGARGLDSPMKQSRAESLE